MLEITRVLARQLRTVFRKIVGRSPVWSPLVTFAVDDTGLRVRLQRADIPAEFLQPGEFESESFTVPFDAFNDFEGRQDSAVMLEPAGSGAVLAQWEDGGVPQAKEYVVEDSDELPAFPDLPMDMTEFDADLLQALLEASRTTDGSSARYALDNLLLRGKQGEVVGTDGRQLLKCNGFRFPWQDNLMVSSLSFLGCRSLPQDDPVRIGRSETHVALQVGPWTFHLPINTKGRYPNVDSSIPKVRENDSLLSIDPKDADFALKVLPRLPGGDEEHSPITVDLGDRITIRAKASGQDRATEAVLSRSTVSGKALRFAVNRHFLQRALQLGFREIAMKKPETPGLCQDESRSFVFVPLPKHVVLAPDKNAVRLESQVFDLSQKRRTAIVTQQDYDERQDADALASKNGTVGATNANGVATLIQEAQALKEMLRDAHQRSNRLVAAVKRHRKQSKLLHDTLSSLRQLPHLET